MWKPETKREIERAQQKTKHKIKKKNRHYTIAHMKEREKYLGNNRSHSDGVLQISKTNEAEQYLTLAHAPHCHLQHWQEKSQKVRDLAFGGHPRRGKRHCQRWSLPSTIFFCFYFLLRFFLSFFSFYLSSHSPQHFFSPLLLLFVSLRVTIHIPTHALVAVPPLVVLAGTVAIHSSLPQCEHCCSQIFGTPSQLAPKGRVNEQGSEFMKKMRC